MIPGLCVPAISSAAEPLLPRGPWLGQGSLRLALSLTPSSAASLGPAVRLPTSRLYERTVPYGTLLAGSETFPLSPLLSLTMLSSPTPGTPTGAPTQFFPVDDSLRLLLKGSAIPYPTIRSEHPCGLLVGF